MTDRPSIVFFGRSLPLALSVLKTLVANERVVGIVESQRRDYRPPMGWKRWVGRGRESAGLERFARHAAIPYLLFTGGSSDELESFVNRLRPDVGVIASMLQLLRPPVISLFPHGILNIHPSLLPNYRGPYPMFWSYYHHDAVAGVTVHFIDPGEDMGDIVKQREIPIPFGERVHDFYRRAARIAGELVVEALHQLADGSLQRRPQRDLPCPFRARFLRPGENPIEWQSWPIERIYHILRGSEGIYDLLPARSFPHSLVRWRVVSFDHKTGGKSEPTIQRRGLRFCIPLSQGRILLRPVPSLSQARHTLGIRRKR